MYVRIWELSFHYRSLEYFHIIFLFTLYFYFSDIPNSKIFGRRIVCILVGTVRYLVLVPVQRQQFFSDAPTIRTLCTVQYSFGKNMFNRNVYMIIKNYPNHRNQSSFLKAEMWNFRIEYSILERNS